MKKKLLSLMLVAAMTVSMAACGSGNNNSAKDGNTGKNSGGGTSAETEQGGASDDADTPAATGDKELYVQIGPDPETIDPALSSAVDGGNMLLHSHECLLTVGEDGSLQPGQAETWETSEDGLTWTFHLREGLKWSDGTDLNANDFVYSWQRVCDPQVAAPYAETVLSMVKGYEKAVEGDLEALAVTAPDDNTLVVELSGPCTFFGSLAAFPTLSPVQKATIEANGDAWATAPETYISNGAFYMTEWVPGSHITFSKNPNYWDKDSIKLDRLKFALIEDPNAAYSAYQTGEVKMIKYVPTEEIPSLKDNEEFHIDTDIATYYISLNLTQKQFQDKKVRQALSLAIDREYVAETLMQGTYSAAGNFMGPGWKDTDGSEFIGNANGGKPYIDTADYEGNLEKAKKLMEEAGYPNGEGFPNISYMTNDAGYNKVVAEYLQQAWSELGINLQVDIVEWASFTPMRRAQEYDVARNAWVGDYDDPSNMLDLLYSTNGNNDGKYNSPEYDAAMDLSRSTIDPKERSEALHKAEDILMEDMGCIPLAFSNDFWLQSPDITGSWHSPYGFWIFKYADVK